ncbi:MAG: 4-(cytidine 5'-diphospho)-2-C-methyl-D-erythritol kinase [Acidobacteria bacterium]|nr:4-(cytidine 5'-diphospho)-2-C-methyl-D-erythritol kinase [Acidobacteriota bacterium]
MKSVSVKAYAKINLGLTVLGRRPDGFHELRTIYQTISLADRLEMELGPGGPAVHLESTGFGVPGGRLNLAVRAAEVILKELRLRSRVTLRLHKQIPPASGLGGASSDAAAVMRAMLHLSGRHMPPERLLPMAAALGSDVPFFLLGGKALGIGRGEEIYALPDGPRRSVVVAFTGQGMETTEAYRRLRRPLLTSIAANPTIELFCSRVNAGAWEQLGNDFEAVVFQALPQLAKVRKILLRTGAERALLAGSGSAMIGIYPSSLSARNAAEQVRRSASHVFIARTMTRREFQSQFPRGSQVLSE